MMPIEQPAREAHAKFAASCSGFLGGALMNWDELLYGEKQAWIAATRHIVEKAKEVH